MLVRLIAAAAPTRCRDFLVDTRAPRMRRIAGRRSSRSEIHGRWSHEAFPRLGIGIAVLAVIAPGLVTSAPALDQPISAVKLSLSRSSSGKEKLVFVSKDPAFLFPALGSADEPGTGSPGGALLELGSLAQPVAPALVIPPGVGKPGWRSKDAKADVHKYANSDAPLGPSPVKALTLKQGKSIKVVAKAAGLDLSGAQGAVGIRLVTGSLRNCAFFDASTIRHDEAGRFDARMAAATALVDCTVMVGGAPTTTTTTSSTTTTLVFAPCIGGAGSPACDGSCASQDEHCAQTLDLRTTVNGCSCYPPGVTPCVASSYPTCGGACSGDGVCQAFKVEGGTVCGCVAPGSVCRGIDFSCEAGVCPPGGACTAIQVGTVTRCGCGPP